MGSEPRIRHDRLQGPPPEFGTWDEWEEITLLRIRHSPDTRYRFILRDPALAQWRPPRWYTRLWHRIFC